ncbi:uncharacterized protein B0I36DRAFT_318247 [Microdochium trichocladiopsis]|uniref:Uncharacterized protein n=1 Tax=Microdochium trichocladiopsis TaxID=1682393 RepID=A0A9P8YBL4_9PEZI|nr:uncharacterized protein B0I36DRAFT_318247 [Microdochium trichocladiopsis]KAH7035391.1 hypothetical protein B0I36DRAFT_318247 [Microdochium trichocladiopsis]
MPKANTSTLSAVTHASRYNTVHDSQSPRIPATPPPPIRPPRVQGRLSRHAVISLSLEPVIILVRQAPAFRVQAAVRGGGGARSIGRGATDRAATGVRAAAVIQTSVTTRSALASRDAVHVFDKVPFPARRRGVVVIVVVVIVVTCSPPSPGRTIGAVTPLSSR